MTTNTLAPTPAHRLVRSTNKKIAGVCGGIAQYLDVDPTVVRVVYAALTFLTGIVPGIIFYAVMVIIMPRADAAT